ncbi:hypothetical protein ACFU7T_21760 [Streptomyces sp. NPDC057555]|uniref:hypothetical protein n=1 Tax=Streptomyces sp. NPDC057555 TaxID=3346166 RepID=UPI0036D20538
MKDSLAHRRVIDLAHSLWDSQNHATNFDAIEGVKDAIGEVGAAELAFAFLDSLLLVITQAMQDSGRDAEEYLLELQLERTDRD